MHQSSNRQSVYDESEVGLAVLVFMSKLKSLLVPDDKTNKET